MGRTDRFVTIDGTELHYSDWGDDNAPPVICVHGLSRVGRDFNPVAARLQDRYRVLCPDMPGRGLSEWADDPETEYTGAAMTASCESFCDGYGITNVRWIDTLMGGTLEMALADGLMSNRLTHLVLNDVGLAPAADEEAQEGIDRISVVFPTHRP